MKPAWPADAKRGLPVQPPGAPAADPALPVSVALRAALPMEQALRVEALRAALELRTGLSTAATVLDDAATYFAWLSDGSREPQGKGTASSPAETAPA